MARRAALPHDRNRAKHCGKRRHVAAEHPECDPAPLRSRGCARGAYLGRCREHHHARRGHRGRCGVAHAAPRPTTRALRASFCARGCMAIAYALLRAHRAHPLVSSADFCLLRDKRDLGAARLGCSAALADRASLRFYAGRHNRCARAVGDDADELRVLLGADRGVRARCDARASASVACGRDVGRACARRVLSLRTRRNGGDAREDTHQRPNGNRRRSCATAAGRYVGHCTLCHWIVRVCGARRADSGGNECLCGGADVWVARKSRCAGGAGAGFLRSDRRFASRFGGIGFCRLFADRAPVLGIGRGRVGNAAYAVAARRNCPQSRDHG